jgi:hypothetical protein
MVALKLVNLAAWNSVQTTFLNSKMEKQ